MEGSPATYNSWYLPHSLTSGSLDVLDLQSVADRKLTFDIDPWIYVIGNLSLRRITPLVVDVHRLRLTRSSNLYEFDFVH